MTMSIYARKVLVDHVRYLLNRPWMKSLGNATTCQRSSSTTTDDDSIKVTVCGAAGQIGQPLSLMLKQSPLVNQLAVYDVRHAKGVGLDLSHVDTKCKICAYEGCEELDDSLEDADIVVIVAGVARQPGQTRDDLFKVNAKIVQELAESCTRACPEALIAVVTNPVNSLVPVVCEIFHRAGIPADNRIFGVTALDVVRANTFVAELLQTAPEDVVVPVVGGHSGKTILPLLSCTNPPNCFSESELKMLTSAIQEAGTIIIKAKNGKGSATMSIAFATARFVVSLCRGLRGQSGIIECALVRSEVVDGVRYFATPVELGRDGIKRNLGLPEMSDYECDLLAEAIPELQKDIRQGEVFVQGENEGEVTC